MQDELEIAIIAGAVSIAVHVCIVVLGIITFQNAEDTIFREKGTVAGWVQCSAIASAVVITSFLPFGILIGTVVWWVLAIRVLKLSVRQTLKINVFSFICQVMLVVTVAGAVA
jgi:hypothetical protein